MAVVSTDRIDPSYEICWMRGFPNWRWWVVIGSTNDKEELRRGEVYSSSEPRHTNRHECRLGYIVLRVCVYPCPSWRATLDSHLFILFRLRILFFFLYFHDRSSYCCGCCGWIRPILPCRRRGSGQAIEERPAAHQWPRELHRFPHAASRRTR